MACATTIESVTPGWVAGSTKKRSNQDARNWTSGIRVYCASRANHLPQVFSGCRPGFGDDNRKTRQVSQDRGERTEHNSSFSRQTTLSLLERHKTWPVDPRPPGAASRVSAATGDNPR